MREPGLFKPESFVRVPRHSPEYKKDYDVIRGKLKSNNEWEDQAYRYPIKTWSTSDARSHCKKHKGSFEAAKPEKKEMPREETVTRALVSDVEIRSIDEAKRTITYVAATENGVVGWMGKEVLRMSGVDLTRYMKNPVVLDTHDRTTIGAIIGSANVSVEGRKLIAAVTYAEGTKRADEAWQLARTKFLKTLSVGFERIEWTDIGIGAFDGEGDGKVAGPARITNKWQLLEISNVPLPGDEDALARKFREREESMENEEIKPEPITGNDPKVETPTEPAPVATEPKEKETESRKAMILDLTPPGFEEISTHCIAEGKTVEEARALILAELAKRTKPVGTPEPPAPPKAEVKESEVAKVPDNVFVRSLIG